MTTKETTTPKTFNNQSKEKPLSPDQEIYMEGYRMGDKLSVEIPSIADQMRADMLTGHLYNAGFLKSIKDHQERMKDLQKAREEGKDISQERELGKS